MDLGLYFKNCEVEGFGLDPNGRFQILGLYELDSVEISWVKAYETHEVAYRGEWDGKRISGTWDIGGVASGTFRISPIKPPLSLVP